MTLWTRLLHRRRLDAELEDEIQAHFAMAARARINRGETPAEAERQSRLEFGNTLLTKEVTREMWGWTQFERLGQDLRYGVRQMRRSPGLTTVAVLSLALGIGANSAIFSILNALLLRPLPVAAPEQLFVLQQQARTTVPQRFSYPMFERLRDSGSGAQAIASMSHVMRAQALLEGESQPEIAPVQLVSGEFFTLLGLSPRMGRFLVPADNENVRQPVAVIGYGFWQRRLAGALDVIGRKIRVNGAAFTIMGVAPEGFRGVWVEAPTDIWVPLAMQPQVHYAQNESVHNGDLEKPWPPQESIDWLDVMVRVDTPSVPAISGRLNAVFLEALDRFTRSESAASRRNFLERSLTLEPVSRGLSNLRQRFTPLLLAMMVLVVLVLLIACANTANLLLARAEARRREIAARLALGAGRAVLARQFLTESLLLSLAAAALGLAIAQWGSALLVRSALDVTSGPAPLAAGVDQRVLAFTMALSLATTLLFGLAPAWRAARLELATAIRAGSRNVTGGSRLTLAKCLVAFQVALSLLVISGAALFVRSLHNLAHVAVGFDTEHVLSVRINPRAGGYRPEQLSSLYRQVIESAEAIPGVRSAAVSMCGLAVECRSSSGGVNISGYEPRPGEEVRVQYSRVAPGYFSTVGVQLAAGRDFDARDSGSRVTVINQALAHRYFGNRNPIGQIVDAHVHIGEKEGSEVIGVVRDARVNRVREPAFPMMYYPLEGNVVYAESLEVRAAGDPTSIAAGVRQRLAAVAPNLPIDRITTLSEQVDRSLNQERLVSVLTTIFGVLALALACFGLSGVLSYAVTRRTSEIGVRMALGARPAEVTWYFLRESLALIASGLVLGFPVVLLVSRWFASMLYEIKPNDPLTLAASAAVLTSVAVVAGLFPAWKASRVSPVVALRHE